MWEAGQHLSPTYNLQQRSLRSPSSHPLLLRTLMKLEELREAGERVWIWRVWGSPIGMAEDESQQHLCNSSQWLGFQTDHRRRPYAGRLRALLSRQALKYAERRKRLEVLILAKSTSRGWYQERGHTNSAKPVLPMRLPIFSSSTVVCMHEWSFTLSFLHLSTCIKARISAHGRANIFLFLLLLLVLLWCLWASCRSPLF